MLYITLRQMEYVVAVDRYRSLTAAAEALNVSQPSLSVAISQVEQRLDGQLFVRRKGAPVTVTAQGREFVSRAQALIATAERLETSFNSEEKSQRPLLQPVRFGIFADLAPMWLAPILKSVRAGLPDIEIVPVIDSFSALAVGLKQGNIDIALTYDLGLDAGFDRVPVMQVAPSAFFSAVEGLPTGSVSLQELARHRLILFEEGLSSQHVLRLFKARGLNPHVTHRVSSLEVLRSLAANGEGVGISYTCPPGRQTYDGAEVETVAISDVEAMEPVVLTTTKSRPTPDHVTVLSDFLADLPVFSSL